MEKESTGRLVALTCYAAGGLYGYQTLAMLPKINMATKYTDRMISPIEATIKSDLALNIPFQKRYFSRLEKEVEKVKDVPITQESKAQLESVLANVQNMGVLFDEHNAIHQAHARKAITEIGYELGRVKNFQLDMLNRGYTEDMMIGGVVLAFCVLLGGRILVNMFAPIREAQ